MVAAMLRRFFPLSPAGYQANRGHKKNSTHLTTNGTLLLTFIILCI